MKLFIPACGDKLILAAPWTFTLYLEYRNTKFAQSAGLIGPKFNPWGRDKLKSETFTLPEGTILECDRVYIRQYNRGRVKLEDDYDSITWRVNKLKGKEGKGRPNGRFWVKLPDCYSIEYRLELDSLYRDRVKLVKEVLES